VIDEPDEHDDGDDEGDEVVDEDAGTCRATGMLGGAAGPLVAGGLGGWSIRSVFVFNAIVYGLMVAFVRRNVRH